MKKSFIYLLVITLMLTACQDKTYEVTFKDDDEVITTMKVKEGNVIGDIPIPTKEGYVFVNWQKDGDDYDIREKVSGDIVLTAKWIVTPSVNESYTVTFNFGSYVKTQTVKGGEPVPKPEHDPEMEKHAFLGWYSGDILYDFETPITKDIILTAKFAKNRITITYDLDGGSGTTVETEIDKDSIPEKPKDPTKFGYHFVNWILDGKPYNFDFKLTEDVTIKANYEAIDYVKVTFDTDGGKEINSEMIEKNTTIANLPTAEKDGYAFKYWEYNGVKFDKNTKITDNITLLAIYEKNIS